MHGTDFRWHGSHGDTYQICKIILISINWPKTSREYEPPGIEDDTTEVRVEMGRAGNSYSSQAPLAAAGRAIGEEVQGNEVKTRDRHRMDKVHLFLLVI